MRSQQEPAQPGEKFTMIELIVQSGKHQGKVLRLPSDNEVMIGRDELCQIRLASSDVSRHHCVLRMTPDGVVARDLDSRNGTYLNETLMEEETLLKPGDILRIGPIVLQVPGAAGHLQRASDDDIASWLSVSGIESTEASSRDTTIIPRPAALDRPPPDPPPGSAARTAPPVPQRGGRGGGHHSAALGNGEEPARSRGVTGSCPFFRRAGSPSRDRWNTARNARPLLFSSGRTFVRIIAGEFRHRRLLANPGLTTRPITDRVKEILFERTQDLLVDRRVADVFAGTGSLGLEALSRGARSEVFLENDRKAFELLKENVAALGVEDRTLCWRTDAIKSSFRPKGVDAFLPFEVVFFDPPYRLAERLGPETPMCKALVRLARDEVTAEEAVLLFRVPKEATIELPPCWRRETSIPISSMEIHVFRKAGRPAENGPAIGV